MVTPDNGREARRLGARGLQIGVRYEFTHGPASAVQRTSQGLLVGFDTEANTYTFVLDDETRVSLVDHEVDAARQVEG